MYINIYTYYTLLLLSLLVLLLLLFFSVSYFVCNTITQSSAGGKLFNCVNCLGNSGRNR